MKSADSLVYRLVVVVEDNEDIGLARAGVVESLEGETAGQGSVSDKGHAAGIRTLNREGLGIAESSADGVGSVSYPECVVLAFAHLRKAAHAVFGAEFSESVLAPGQDLMCVSLMADIEDELVLGGVVDVMETDYELDCTKARSEVAGVVRTDFHHITAELRAKLPELIHAERLEVGWQVYAVQYAVHRNAKIR